MSWVDPLRRLKIRANADIPRDAKTGTHVRRRRHRTLPHRAHVLCRRPHRAHAHHDSGRQREGPPRRAEEAAAHAARRLCGLVQGDGIAAGDHPPARSAAARVPAQARRSAGARSRTSKTPSRARPSSRSCVTLLARVEELHEQNPMLGLRGCRLGITFPEITEMQARAIFEAAVAASR